MQVDLSGALSRGFANMFLHMGRAGKVALCIIVFVVVFPFILRVLSFFRRGGTGV